MFSGSGQNCFDTPGLRGPCKAAFKKWTFAGGSCIEFLYGGCQGNGNQFGSLSQCQAVCLGGVGGQGGGRGNKGAVQNGNTGNGNSQCSLTPFVFGSCSFSLTKWSYIVATDSCQAYTYSGCSEGVVTNRFNTLDQCISMCVNNVIL